MSEDTFLISKIISKIWKTDTNLSDELILKKALTSTIYPKCIEACCKYLYKCLLRIKRLVIKFDNDIFGIQTQKVYENCCIMFNFYFEVLNTRIFQNVDQIAKENLQKSSEILKSLFKDLVLHNVNVCDLEFILSKKEMLFVVADLFENHFSDSHPLKRSELENILQCREKDRQALKKVYDTVVILRFFFKVINKGKLQSLFSFSSNILKYNVSS